MAVAKETHKPLMNILANPRTERGLTVKQEKFCRIYATSDVTQTEAARLAGYDEKNSAWVASRFLNNRDYPHIIDRVKELKLELSVKYEVTFDNHVRKLAEIRDAALLASNFPAAVSAEKSRGQAAGLYISRQEILVGKIDQMSKEEVMTEIRRLQAEFPLLIQDTSPKMVIEHEAIVDDAGKEIMARLEEEDGEEGPLDAD